MKSYLNMAGFSLISLMIYFSIQSILLFMLFMLITPVINTKYKQEHNRLLANISLYSILSRYIRGAPCLTQQWVPTTKPSTILWYDSTGLSTGFIHKNSQVVRVHGTYNPETNTIRGVSNTVAYAIDQIEFSLFQENNCIQSVTVQWSDSSGIYQYNFVLRNRCDYE